MYCCVVLLLDGCYVRLSEPGTAAGWAEFAASIRTSSRLREKCHRRKVKTNLLNVSLHVRLMRNPREVRGCGCPTDRRIATERQVLVP